MNSTKNVGKQSQVGKAKRYKQLPPVDSPYYNPRYWRDYTYYLRHRKGKETKKIGAKAWRSIERIVRLCKGEYTDPKAYTFFRYITTIETDIVPDTWQEVQEQLQEAWWVEEEDVAQECKAFILSRKTGGGYTLRHLVCHISRWLVSNQQVFKRLSNWEEHYEYEYVSNKESDLQPTYTENTNYKLISGSLYPKLTRYENYIAYWLSLGYSKTKLAATIGKHSIINNEIPLINSKLRSYND